MRASPPITRPRTILLSSECSAVLTGLLLGDPVGLLKARLGLRGDGCGELGVLGRGLPVPGGLAGLGLELLDDPDGFLHGLVAEHDRAEHDVLGQHLGLGFDHENGLLRSRHDQVERGVLQLGPRRVQHVRAVDVADPGTPDGTFERNPRQRQGRRSAKHGRDVRIDVRVRRHDGGDHLDFIEEVLREQRPDGTIDEPRSERLLLGRAALALEEPARDPPRGVGLLLVVDRQREEALPFGCLSAADGRHEDDSVGHGDKHGRIGLACDFTGLDDDFVVAVPECLLDRSQIHFFCLMSAGPLGPFRGVPYRRRPRREMRSW
jgi:hypothetical protein